MKSDYRYSKDIVYNNFPWPGFESKQAAALAERAQAAINTAAQSVLDARAESKESTLADLYDPLAMPAALVKAHQKLDKAVDAAARVAFLFTSTSSSPAPPPAPVAKTPKLRKPRATP